MKSTILILSLFTSLIWYSITDKSYVQPNKALITFPTDTIIIPGERLAATSIGAFLTKGFRNSLSLRASDSLRLLSQHQDRMGGKHARVQQLFRGIPVFGAWSDLHEKNGTLSFSTDYYFRDLKLQTEPVLEEAEALAQALALLPASLYAWEERQFEAALQRQRKDVHASFFPKGELLIVPKQLFQESPLLSQPENEFRLAWQFDVFALEPEMKRELIFIDAMDGSLLHRLPQMAFCHTPARGKAAYIDSLVNIATDSCNSPATPPFRLHDAFRDIEICNAGNTNSLAPIRFYNSTTEWLPPESDTVAIAALYGLEIWYDYLAQFQWYGLTGERGYPMEAWVHYKPNFENAVYNGFLLFGDGNGSGKWKTPLVCRDIVAHEATHGLIEHTCGLLYVYEPGILNEGIADIFACLVELEQGDGNWVLGEEIIPGGSRRLDFPHLLGLPDTYKGHDWTEQAAPGQALHHNSVVLGHWFYLLSEGGIGTNDFGTDYAVQPMERKKAADLLFHTLRYFVNPNDGFYEFRLASLRAAGDLGWDLEAINNLGMAWCAIGVGNCANEEGKENVSLLSPKGGEEFYPGDPIPLEWTNSQGVNAVKIIMSANDGAKWQQIATYEVTDTSNEEVILAPNINSRLCRIRIVAANDPLVFDDSDEVFSIISCGLLSSFTSSPESGCVGTNFIFDNITQNTDADFSWLLDGHSYPAPSTGFMLQISEPGMHSVSLIAQTGTCIDTFSRTIQVAPTPSADFNYALSNLVVTAAASFSEGEQYQWIVDGQRLPAFAGSKNLTWMAPAAGTYELCLLVEDNCSPAGEQVCQVLEIEVEPACIGNAGSWKQAVYTNEILDIAEKGDTLYIATPGGLIELYDKESGDFNLYNTVNSGLHALPLTGVAVRNDGTVVVGTKDCGLALFDGKNWEVISASEPPFWLYSNRIGKIEQSQSGDIWIVSSSESAPKASLTKWSADDTYQNYLHNTGLGIYDFTTRGDDVFISSNGGVVNINKSGEMVLVDSDNPVFNENRLRSIAAADSILWFASAYSGLYRYDLSTKDGYFFNPFTDPPYPYNYVWHVYTDKEGQAWSATDYVTGKIVGTEADIFGSQEGLVSGLNVFFEDQAGILWGGNEDGLFRFNGTNWVLVDLSTNDFTYYSYSDPWDLEIAPNGMKYLAYGHQLFEISDIDADWKYLNNYCGSSKGQLAVDTANNIWTGGFLYSNFGACPSYTQLGYPGSSITSMAAWEQYMCFASDSGLHFYDIIQGEWTTTPNNELNAPPISLIESKTDEGLWITIEGGTLAELEQNGMFNYHSPPPGVLSSSSEFELGALGQNGDIWLSESYPSPPWSKGYRLTKYNSSSKSWTIMTALNAAMGIDAINEIEVDLNNVVWIGHQSKGLVRFDPAQNSWEFFNTCNSGLPGNTVYSIEFDQDGSIWITTNNGIGILTPSSQVIQTAFVQQETACIGSPIVFNNTTLGAGAWEWRLNGQLISTERNLVHTFFSAGDHVLELTAFNLDACGTSVSKVISVHPVASLTDFPENFADCQTSALICAPEGMAQYKWEKGGLTVGTEKCLNIDQSNSGVFKLTTTDYCGGVATKTIGVSLSGACVYPGDLNNDGIVDFRDLVMGGIAIGGANQPRSEQGINWKEYPALDWNGHLPNGANFKYCDADGSGFIDLSDLEAVIINYGNTHSVYPNLPGPEQSPFAFIPNLVKFEKLSGENTYLIVFDIMAQNINGKGIDNFYSAGMRMYFVLPEGVNIASTPEFTFNNSTLGTNGRDAVGMVKVFSDKGYMDVGFTRTDLRNKSGVDVLGTASFIVVDDHLPIWDSLHFTLNLIGNMAMTNNGNFLPINGGEKTFSFTTSQVTGVQEFTADSQLMIYPNPTTGRCRVQLPNTSVQGATINVYNLHGTEVKSAVINGETHFYNLNLMHAPPGIYLVVITTAKARYVGKMVKT